MTQISNGDKALTANGEVRKHYSSVGSAKHVGMALESNAGALNGDGGV